MHCNFLFSYWRQAKAHRDLIRARKEQPFHSCSEAASGCSLMVSAPQGSASIHGRFLVSQKQESQWKKGKYNQHHLAEQKLKFIDINRLTCNYPKYECDRTFFRENSLSLNEGNILDKKIPLLNMPRKTELSLSSLLPYWNKFHFFIQGKKCQMKL